MTANWQLLRNELAIWQAEGLKLPFWWRDDDAIEPTKPLNRLLQLSQGFGMPIHLAIIPKYATSELVHRLADAPQAVPVTHGLAHVNHAPKGQKKCEFGPDRLAEDIETDIAMACSKLQFLFSDRLSPMFVPPWNRFAPAGMPVLAAAGYRAISTFTPRKQPYICDGLHQINTHIDPIDWHNSRSVHPTNMLIGQSVKILQQRRNGAQDNSEPLGYLTHHLVHDAAIWDFTERFIETMLAGPVTLWNANSLKG